MRYKYMVAYQFQHGFGRCFMYCKDPLNTEDRILGAEEEIKKASNLMDRPVIMNMILLDGGK